MQVNRFKPGLRWLLPCCLLVMGFDAVQVHGYDETTAVATEAPAEPPAADADAPVAAEPQATTETAAAPAEVPEYYSKKEIDYTINTLVMMICAVLVIFMQAGFALVEVGLNAAKNAVNILFKNLMDFAIGVVLYLFVGYGLMYPGADYAGKWFGFAGSYVTRDLTTPNATGWSSSADFVFQVAFAATAATIVSGAVAGRMKFSAYLVYSAVISAFVYPISGMWKWGGGWLAAEGFADFAGSVVVHAVGGFAGLAGAMLLGPRIGRYTADGKSIPMLPHNMTFAALGVFILWVGWYGFNPGSQLTYSGISNSEVTTYIALTTTLSGAAGCCVAMFLSWIVFGKPDLSMALNGALAGLVGVTASCNQVEQGAALIIGVASGFIVFGGILLLDKLRIDDPVGAFPVHGLCGMWGGIATGIFGTAIPTVNEVVLTRAQYIILQIKGTLVISIWAFVTMLLVFGFLKMIGMLRVPAEEEIEGLDIVEHGMPAYGPTTTPGAAAMHSPLPA